LKNHLFEHAKSLYGKQQVSVPFHKAKRIQKQEDNYPDFFHQATGLHRHRISTRETFLMENTF
jgi:hypothetical protein